MDCIANNMTDNEVYYQNMMMQQQYQQNMMMQQQQQQQNQYNQHISGVYNPPVNAHYTQINVGDINSEVMKIVIGKNGKVFKAITHQSNVQYIWYNIENKYIEIWGPEHNLQDAYDRIINRLTDICAKINTGKINLKGDSNQEDNEDTNDDDMME